MVARRYRQSIVSVRTAYSSVEVIDVKECSLLLDRASCYLVYGLTPRGYVFAEISCCYDMGFVESFLCDED